MFPNEPHQKVVTIRYDDTFGEAFKRMIQHQILSVVVVDEKHTPKGIFDLRNVLSFLFTQFEEDDFGPGFYLKISSLLSDSPHADKARLVYKTKISEILKGTNVEKEPVFVMDQSPLITAVRLMCDLHIHSLVVCNQEGHLRNIITQSRIVKLINFMEIPKLEKTVQELNIGTREVITVLNTETAFNAFKTMISKGISGLPVVNDKGEIVGNISMSDIKLISWNVDYWNYLGLPIWDYIAHLANHPESLYIRDYSFWSLDRPQTVVLKCTEQDKLGTIVRMMCFFKVHRIYITKDNKPIGVVSTQDVINAVVCNAH